MPSVGQSCSSYITPNDIATATIVTIHPATTSVTGTLSTDADWSLIAVELIPAIAASGPKILATNDGHFGGDRASAGLHLPTEVALSPSYPNPFRHGTTIEYALPVQDYVRIVVYNAAGRRVTTPRISSSACGRV